MHVSLCIQFAAERILGYNLKIKMSQKRKTSDAWAHFDKKSDDNKAVCMYCKAEISRGGKNAITKGYTTSNMWAHLKRFHNDEWSKTKSHAKVLDVVDTSHTSDKKQATIPHLLERNSHYDVNDNRALEITKIIAETICLDMEPLDIVNKTGFKRLVNKLCPRYTMVSRTHMTETILPNMYERVKQKLKLQLQEMHYLSVTTDLWTSDNSSQLNDFISITVHGINTDFKLKSFCLEVFPFEGDGHTGENIAHNMHLTFLEWEISNKLLAIVTDNASNMKKAVRELGMNVDHIPCMAHTFQLVLKDGLLNHEANKTVVDTSRKIITYFNQSTTALKELAKVQKELNIPQHVLIQDVETRWDSTYQMLNRLYEQRVAIQAILPLPHINCKYELNTQQWVLIQQICKILCNFDEVTKNLSKDYTTLSQAIPLVNSIIKCMEKMENDRKLHQTVRNMATDIKNEVFKRFGTIEDNETFILATALDPRYKHRIFRLSTTPQKVRTLLVDKLKFATTQNKNVEYPPNIPQQLEHLEPQPSTASTSQGSIWDICKEIMEEATMIEPLSNFLEYPETDEVDTYLRIPNLNHSEDAFLYWKENINFPNLKRLAYKYFSLKASSVPSERLFSTAGLIQTTRRNRLTPTNLQLLCFLNKNLPRVNFDY